jgi:hypothetical protein
MNYDIQKLLAPPGLEATAFPVNSRYHGIGTKEVRTETGKSSVHLKRRIVPPPDSLSLLQQHTVVQGDRLDNLAHKYFGDPELFWRICDANGAIRPRTLTETVSRLVHIAGPEGIPGGTNA